MKKLNKIIVLVLLTIFVNFSIVNAQELTLSEIRFKIKIEPISNCEQNLTLAYDIHINAFLAFIQTTFRNKSSNSSLTNIALGRYAEFSKALDDLMGDLSPKITGRRTQEELNAYQNCIILTQTYKNEAKQVMLNHIRATTAVKQTTAIGEKYKSLNKRLRGLHFEIAKMFGSYASMKSQLPGFLRSCF